MGFQFLHIEGYGRSAGKGKASGHTVASVLAEAARLPDACPHVAQPRDPVLLFGCPLSEIAGKVETWAESARDSIGRKLRKDGLCLLAGVVSAPDDMKPEQWEEMKQATLDYLNRDGRLVSAVEHLDENHRHIHIYKLPGAGQRFETIHPGRAAAAAAKETGAVKGEQNAAYKKAMRRLQDDFFAEVGCRFGLTRLGPGRRRLTRAAWKAEQQSVVAIGAAMAKADTMTTDAIELSTFAATIRQEADTARASALALAEIAKADADKATAALALSKEKREANQRIVAKWSKERSAMQAMAKKIEVERQTLDALRKVSARIGMFFGSIVGKAVDAAAAVFEGRKAKDAAKDKALKGARLTARNEAARRLAAEQAVKSAVWERDAIKDAASKQQREAEAERTRLAEIIEVLQPAKPSRQSNPAPRPRL